MEAGVVWSIIIIMCHKISLAQQLNNREYFSYSAATLMIQLR